MQSKGRLKHIWQELMCHAPYTFGGAVVGIIFMLLFKDMGRETGSRLFSIFHPGHVLLSAMVTTSLYSMHTKKKNLLAYLVIGYVGSIGIATLSDSVIPYMGEEVLGVSVPTHASLHEQESEVSHEHSDSIDPDSQGQADLMALPDNELDHEHAIEDEHDHEQEYVSEHETGHEHGHGLHLGFIEEWYIVNPAALAGIAIAWFIPRSRYPHAAHILLSTWASSSHMLMNTHAEMSLALLAGMFVVLVIAVWLPCCVSDIVFPLLFAKGDIEQTCRCTGPKHCHARGEQSDTPDDHNHKHCDCGH